MVPALSLSICAVLLTACLRGASGWSIKLTCPNPFINGRVNDIILDVNSTKIDEANCLIATDVAFEFVTQSSPTVYLLGSHSYDPRPTCNDFTTPNTAGCTTHIGDIYTYKYTFPVDGTREGGRVKVSFCFNPSGPYTETVSDSCNSISFTDSEDCCETETFSLRLILPAQVVDVATIVAICGCVYTNFPLICFWKLIAVGVAVAFLIVVILMAVAFSYACNNFPENDPSICMCLVVYVVAVLDVVWITITGIIIVLRKNVLCTVGKVLDFPLRGSLKNKAIVTVSVSVIVAAVIFTGVAIYYASKVSICYTTRVILMLVLAQVALALAEGIEIYLCVWKNIQLTGCSKNKAFVIGLVLTIVVVVICMAVALTCGCKNFPEDDPCYCLCFVVIVVAVLDVVVDLIIGIFIFVRKYPGCENKCLLLLCIFFVVRIVALIVALIAYIVRLCTKDRSPVTITSNRSGQSNDSYDLTWTVPGICNKDIETFSIKYIQVEADTSSEPWKAITPRGDDSTINVNGKCRCKTLKSLSADTFYQVTITVIKKTGSSEGSPFVFQTAK